MTMNTMTDRTRNQTNGDSAHTAEQSMSERPNIRRSVSTNAPSQRRQLLSGPEYDMARFLGWFSIGLGTAELLIPGVLAKLAGAHSKHKTLVRLAGLRELGHGVAILGQSKPASGIWSRVAGDAMDLVLLRLAMLRPGAHRRRLTLTTLLIGGITAMDYMCARDLSGQPSLLSNKAVPVRRSIIVNRPPEELYRFWHNVQNLPRFMKHLQDVQVKADGQSHWVATAPAGNKVEWDAVITEDVPNERIAWRSLAGSDIENSGMVEFERAPKGDGTIVHVSIAYSPPGGILGVGVAKLFGEEPAQQVEGDLRRFKQVLETGEVVLSDATVNGTSLFAQRPARPVERTNGNGNGHIR